MITNIPVYQAPFQGGTNGVDITTAPSDIYIAATQQMQFVNSGYTMLFVKNSSGGAVTLTIQSIPDNAGRIQDIGPVTIAAGVTRMYGAFKPIWWNNGGLVQFSFSAAPTNVYVAAVQIQF